MAKHTGKRVLLAARFLFYAVAAGFLFCGCIFIVVAPSDTGLNAPPRINVAFSEENNYALEILSCHSNSLSIDSILKGSFKPTLVEGFGKGRIQPLQEIRWKKTHPQMDTEPIVK